jgi:PAS domain S-box-containing protein
MDDHAPAPHSFETLQRSAQELAAIFDSDAMAIAVVAKGVFVRCNRKYEHLYGYAPGGLVGQSARVVFANDEEYAELTAAANSVMSAGKTYRQDHQTRDGQGNVLWLQVTGTALDARKPEAGTVWLVNDITYTRQHEEHMRRTFEAQQMMFDNAAVGIMLATRRKVVRCNQAMGAIFGYTPEELIGKSTRVFYESDEEYKSAGLLGYPSILSGKAFVHEMRITHKNGNRVWVRATGRQIPMGTPGEDINWIFEDVNARREAELALQTAHTELQERVAELQRTQTDLVQAEKLAALGALVAGIAHELNTPLGNTLVSASTLRDRFRGVQADMAQGQLRRSSLDKFLTDGADIADLVFRSAHRAADLISSFKQVAVDQTSEQRRRFEVAAVVEDIVSTLRPSFKRDPWVVTTDIAEGLVCDSYPGPLGQIVANMVNNAVAHAFSGRDHGSLSITGQMQQDTVILEFKDDGCGVDPAHMVRIFDPFFTTRLRQGGSGLGLSISRNIAKGLLGGSLTVTSTPGQGTCFRLIFPRNAPDTLAPEVPPEPVP